ncbi:MAG: hypothetical protein AAFQ99_12860, partial [Pseudomonadota bacterium]
MRRFQIFAARSCCKKTKHGICLKYRLSRIGFVRRHQEVTRIQEMQDHTINQPRAASVIDAQGFELARINPGARTDTIRADQIFVDIYLGGATAEYVSDNGEHIVAQCPPNSFTFLPAGHAREVRRTRTGTAVQLLMGTNAVQQFSVHEGVNLARSEPLWHTFDHGMIGIATIISDHLRTAGDPIHPEIGKGYVRLILLRLAQIVARETVVG